MKAYTYSGLTRYLSIVSQIITGIVVIGLTLFALVFSIAAISAGPSRWGVLLLYAWMLIFIWGVGLTLINASPSIWLDEGGLTISAFIVQRIRIPWRDIVNIVPSVSPYSAIVIQARRITPFHRLIGLIYSRRFIPSFMIQSSIDNHAELLRDIRRRTGITAQQKRRTPVRRSLPHYCTSQLPP